MKRIRTWALPGLAALGLLAGHGAVAAEEVCRLLQGRREGVSHYAVASVLKLRANSTTIKPVMVLYRVANCAQALVLVQRQMESEFPDFVYDPNLTIVMEVAPVAEAAPVPQAPERVRPGRRIEDQPMVEI